MGPQCIANLQTLDRRTVILVDVTHLVLEPNTPLLDDHLERGDRFILLDELLPGNQVVASALIVNNSIVLSKSIFALIYLIAFFARKLLRLFYVLAEVDCTSPSPLDGTSTTMNVSISAEEVDGISQSLRRHIYHHELILANLFIDLHVMHLLLFSGQRVL